MKKSAKKKGKITPNGVVLETQEIATVVYFTELGYDIELIKPSRTPGQKSADFMMAGIAWESKAPMGKSPITVDHMLQKAAKQSESIIVDLRNSQAPEQKTLEVISRRYKQTRKIRRLKIIKKSGTLLEFSK